MSFRLSGRFLGIVSLVFSKFWHPARNPYEVVRDRGGFSGNFFVFRKWTKNRPKTRFLKFLKNLVIIFYWICSIMKIDLFAVFLHKFHVWENFCSWDIGLNVLSQSDCRIFLINHISKTNQWNSVIFCMSIQIHVN